ncbi:LamG domain-containing protein [Luteimonas aquatica]|uniref:LamG domain-containing protein n=1 Tax=Luteimonas aquatica TaxID=450364 RepID=UPI001F56ABAE|nr:LamG domain-containing protein [Luteimonas aquatica]
MKKGRLLLGTLAAALPFMTQALPVGSTNALTGQWKLENAGTTAYDTSGFGANGLVSWGAPASWGWQDGGANLGGGIYYQMPGGTTSLNVGAGDFTVAAWIRMDNDGTVKTILDNGGSTTTGYTFSVQDTQRVALTMVGPGGGYGSTFASSGPLALMKNRWHHVAATVLRAPKGQPPIVFYPIPTITFYIDGRAAGTATPIMDNVDNTFSGDVTIGGSHWSSYRFNDRLDEVMVYKRAMNAAQIAEIMAPGLPSYDPSYWNGSARRPYNNCYNYANNRATNTFAQPGRAAGQTYTALSCSAVHAAAVRDGLEPIAPSQIGAASYKDVVALVVAPGDDYHWYRRDQNGMWTHKPGGTNATNLDNAGSAISNPETANRGPYSDFCGYFRVWSDSFQGAGHEQVN